MINKVVNEYLNIRMYNLIFEIQLYVANVSRDVLCYTVRQQEGLCATEDDTGEDGHL